MKSFLARVFAMHPFLLAAAGLLLPPASAWLWWHAFHPDHADQVIRAEVDRYMLPVAHVITGDPDAADPQLRKNVADRVADRAVGLLQPVSASAQSFIGGLNGQVAGIRSDLRQESSAWRGTTLIAVGTLNARAAGFQGVLDQTRRDLDPAIAGAAELESTYAAIPGQLAKSRAWQKFEPEITCETTDAFGVRRGYSNCWHSSVTGILGEIKKSGGVFTENFPKMVTSIDSITQSVAAIVGVAQRFIARFDPAKPTTFWGRVKGYLGLVWQAFLAYLRGGH